MFRMRLKGDLNKNFRKNEMELKGRIFFFFFILNKSRYVRDACY